MPRSSPKWSVQDGHDFSGHDVPKANAAFTKMVTLNTISLTSGLKPYMVGLPFDAEDVMQTTFERAWRGRSTFHSEAEPLPWLYGIAKRTRADMINQSIDGPRIHFRKQEQMVLRALVGQDKYLVKSYAFRGGSRRSLESVLDRLDSQSRTIIVSLLDRSDEKRREFRERRERGRPTDIATSFYEWLTSLRDTGHITEDDWITLNEGISYGRTAPDRIRMLLDALPQEELEPFRWWIDTFITQWDKATSAIKDDVDRIVFREKLFSDDGNSWAHDLAERIVPQGTVSTSGNSEVKTTLQDRRTVSAILSLYLTADRKAEVKRLAAAFRQRWSRLKQRISD